MKTLDEFLARFVTPLCAGGDVHVGEPIAPRLLERWEVELGAAAPALEVIDAARTALASSLVVRPAPLVFGEEELRLSAALHAALTLAHPGTRGLGTRRGRRELAAWSLELARAMPAVTPTVAIARHTLLGRIFELTRVDTQVRWWTGKADFRGVAPPSRLLRWRRLRRVREESTEVGLSEVLAADDTRHVVTALLGASPLTDLLSLDGPTRRFPPFRWGPQVELLRHVELARAVAYAWLAGLGASPAPRLRACAAAAAAWEQALATPLELLPRPRPAAAGEPGALRLAPLLALPARAAPPLSPADVRATTAFLVHLNALCAVAEAQGGDLDGPSPLVAASLAARRSPELGQPEATGLRLFFCVPDVAARCDPHLGTPPGLAADPRVARRWAAHRGQVRAALGEERLGQLARRLAVCA